MGVMRCESERTFQEFEEKKRTALPMGGPFYLTWSQIARAALRRLSARCSAASARARST